MVTSWIPTGRLSGSGRGVGIDVDVSSGVAVGTNGVDVGPEGVTLPFSTHPANIATDVITTITIKPAKVFLFMFFLLIP